MQFLADFDATFKSKLATSNMFWTAQNMFFLNNPFTPHCKYFCQNPVLPLTGYISGTKHFQEVSLLPLERAWNFEEKRLVMGAVPTKPTEKLWIFFWKKCKSPGKEGENLSHFVKSTGQNSHLNQNLHIGGHWLCCILKITSKSIQFVLWYFVTFRFHFDTQIQESVIYFYDTVGTVIFLI